MHSIKTLLFLAVVALATSCSYDNMDLVTDESGYPADISKIIVGKCATAGCHNNASRTAANGLSLETWDEMFKGGNSGATVIPYRPDFSTLMFTVNTDSTQGLILIPSMPYNEAPLSQSEYLTLKDWIAKGAPDKKGNVKFTDPSKEKMYVTNSASDNVMIIDAESGLIGRAIDVGELSTIETPRMVKVAPDNRYWYVVFSASTVMQKYNTSDNVAVGSVDLGAGSWNTISISHDSKKAFVIDLETAGKIDFVNLETMTVDNVLTGLNYPGGVTLNDAGDILYVTSQTGNFIYKIPVDNPSAYSEISLDPFSAPSTIPSLNPHEIIFSNDFSKYYVTCQETDQVRVMQTSNDSLLATIATGDFPVGMAMSSTKPYLFVTCRSTYIPGSTVLGSVSIIDVNTNSVFKTIFPGHQPNGICVSDQYNKVFVANRNVSHGGPAAHHPSPFGRNGYITAIDLNTLELLNYKAEVSVDPYNLEIKH